MTSTHSNNTVIKNISVKNNSGLDFILSQRKPTVIKPISLPTSTSVGLGKLVTSGFTRIQ
jgi:hypothetical protein